MYRLKIKAGALQLTIFVMVIIVLLLSSFILFVHTNKQFKVKSDFIIETTKLSNKGIAYTLQNPIHLNDTININLNDEDFKSLNVYRCFWGVFEQVGSRATIKNKRFHKTAYIGSQQDNNRTALYVKDNNKPLVLVGSTKIVGNSYLPKQGVKTGYISGHSYYGSKLIYGSTIVSSDLPKLSSEVINNITKIEKTSIALPQYQFLNIQDIKRFSNSFLNPVRVVCSKKDINLVNIELVGRILIQSNTKIVVYPSSNLKDVILVAPEIEIRPNTIGCFQAIASKEIIVGKNVELNYPSALVLKEKQTTPKSMSLLNSTEKEPKITINKNATIKGIVLCLGLEKPNNYKSQILLKENATVYGELYNTQNTELLGRVNGIVYTNNFIANQSGSVYQNHIYNGEININNLPPEYIGLLFKGSKKNVLKWLY